MKFSGFIILFSLLNFVAIPIYSQKINRYFDDSAVIFSNDLGIGWHLDHKRYSFYSDGIILDSFQYFHPLTGLPFVKNISKTYYKSDSFITRYEIYLYDENGILNNNSISIYNYENNKLISSYSLLNGKLESNVHYYTKDGNYWNAKYIINSNNDTINYEFREYEDSRLIKSTIFTRSALNNQFVPSWKELYYYDSLYREKSKIYGIIEDDKFYTPALTVNSYNDSNKLSRIDTYYLDSLYNIDQHIAYSLYFYNYPTLIINRDSNSIIPVKIRNGFLFFDEEIVDNESWHYEIITLEGKEIENNQIFAKQIRLPEYLSAGIYIVSLKFKEARKYNKPFIIK